MSGTRDPRLQVDAAGRAYVMIGGVRAYIGTEAECERADFVVCGPKSYFADDVWTRCADCGTAICHRPYVPKAPPKICLACMVRNERATKQ